MQFIKSEGSFEKVAINGKEGVRKETRAYILLERGLPWYKYQPTVSSCSKNEKGSPHFFSIVDFCQFSELALKILLINQKLISEDKAQIEWKITTLLMNFTKCHSSYGTDFGTKIYGKKRFSFLSNS